MDGEAAALIKVLSWLLPSMAYAHYPSSSTSPGSLRLVSLLPIVILLPFLPLHFSSLHLRSISAFFLLWLSVFKLLLLSFGVGPLSPSLPLPAFVAISSLPVKLRSNASPTRSFSELLVPSAMKLLLFCFVVSLYRHKAGFHPYFLVSLYLSLDLVLACTAFLVSAFLGREVEPQFDAPLKSSSLQDFWGRRWNLMVTGILRPSVYHPVSARYGTAAGVMAASIVSGLMHEVIFWYLTLTEPTGEVWRFFLLHGICTMGETAARRKGCWRLRSGLASIVTVGFVTATACWLFLLPVLRSGADRIVVEECEKFVGVLEDTLRAAASRVGSLMLCIFLV